MPKIGTLFYDINGNDNLKKILEEDKKRALELQRVLKETNAIMGKIDLRQLKQYSSIIAKSQIDSARLASINRKSDDESIIRQQRLQTEIERTNAAHQRYINATVSGHKKINSSIGLTNKTLFSQQNLMTQLSQAAGIYFSVYQVGSFIRSLYTVSGEFEKQKVSLGAILQSTEQAGVLYERIKDLAVKSPFQFSELISYTKQLSAFSVPYNELFDTTKRLADVSAGLGVDMNRLVLAFGQVRSASVLRGQELRQFTEAGIPLVDELAKKFTKLTGEATSAGDVFDKISRRQVSFQMVKDIFTELTSEGGKFYKFQEIQAESLAGKLSNLKDSYQIMLSQIGEGNSGVMKDSVELLTTMMNNWESISKTIKSLVVAYGTYRTVIMLVNAAEKANIALTGAQRAMDLINLIRASKGLTAATYGQVIAQRTLNMVMSINPYVAIATAIAALVGGLVFFSEKTKTATEIQNEFNNSIAEQQQKMEDLKNTSQGYIKTATDLSLSYANRKKALDSLQGILPSVFKNMTLEKLAAIGLAEAYNMVNKAIDNTSISSAKLNYQQSTKAVIEAQRELELAIKRETLNQLRGGSGTGTIDGKPQNASQSTANSYANRLAESNVILDDLGSKFAGKIASLPAFNFMKSKDRQAYEQAQKNFVTAVLRRESGASIAPSEFGTARDIYFPKPGDSMATVLQKAKSRNTVINNFFREANVLRPVLPGQVISSGGKKYKVGLDGETLTQI